MVVRVWDVRRLLIVIGLIVAALLLEGGARLLLFHTRGDPIVGLQERTLYLQYRPFVMFGPDWDATLRSRQGTVANRRYRILLLGGSTAESFPAALIEEAFAKRFPPHEFEVVHAAQGGYNARQELIVAALWGPAIRPDMILSLDGANDLSHRIEMERAGTFFLDSAYALALEHPWLAPLADLARHSQAFQAVRRMLGRQRVGPAADYLDAIAIYISAEHGLNVLAKGITAERVMVLQPFVAYKTPLSAEERRFTAYQYREGVMKELYEQTARQLATIAAEDGVTFVDGRVAFQGVEERMFSDDVHFADDEGYRRLADWIARSIPANAIAFYATRDDVRTKAN
jgi:hypothetical protein